MKCSGYRSPTFVRIVNLPSFVMTFPRLLHQSRRAGVDRAAGLQWIVTETVGDLRAKDQGGGIPRVSFGNESSKMSEFSAEGW